MTSIPRRPSARITILPFVISVVLVYLNCCSAPFGALNNPYDAKNPSYVAVTGVSLNATTLSLSVGGGSSTLTATIAPSNATGTGVTWSSSAPSVGTVNSNGVVSPVTVGTTTIAVTTTDGGKTATCAVMVTATPSTPAMPTGVSASAGNAQVTISWTAVSGATSYNLYWSTTSGVTKTSGTKITGVTSPYTQTGLTNGTTYYYVVTAVTAGGESAASNQASATPQVPAPSAPTGVSAISGNAQVTVSWTAVSGATSYNLYWSTTSGVTPSTGTKITGVASPYTQTGLTNGTTYYYVVTAVTAGGESAASNQASATPQVPAPSAPTGVSAISGNAQVTVSWTAVSGATSYNLYWSTTSGVTPSTGTKITGVASPYTQTGLTNGTTYYYVVTAVTAGGESAASNQASATPQVPTPSIQMVSIPAGSFNNGTSVVTLSAFHMSEYDITQSQYQAMTGTNPSYFSSNADAATCPVEQVTWYDAVEFCNKLSSSAGLTPVYTITGRTPATGYPITSATVTADFTQNGYRLPTEAQWEYACRAGTTTTFFWGNTSGDPDATTESYAWYASNSNNTTHGVGQKLPNPWGLYDIVGDVWQWCWDWYGTYPSGPQTNPIGPSSGTDRVFRGGSWCRSSDDLASAYRDNTSPRTSRDCNIGFRVAAP